MSATAGTPCLNCRQYVQTFRFKVMVVQRTKTITYNMQMCGACAHQLLDVLTAASDLQPEVFDASEGSGSAQTRGQSRAAYRA